MTARRTTSGGTATTRLPRAGDAALPAARSTRSRASCDEPVRAAAPRALRRRHRRADLRAPRPGARAAGLCVRWWGSGSEPPPAARYDAAGSPSGCEAGLRAPVSRARCPAGRLAVRPDRARRRARAPVRPADRDEARQPTGTSSCPTSLASGFFRPGSPEADGPAPVPARPRLALPRARALRAAHRRHEPGLPAAGLGRRLRHERRALPRRQRPARPAPAQPLRQARRGDDARTRSSRARARRSRPVTGPVLPLDAPAAEQREQRLLPRDAAAAARARDDGRERPPQGLELAYSTPRAWLEPGKQIAVRGMRTSFGPLSLLDRLGRRRGARPARRAHGLTGPLRLRLRLPAGQRIAAVTVNGTAVVRLRRRGDARSHGPGRPRRHRRHAGSDHEQPPERGP